MSTTTRMLMAGLFALALLAMPPGLAFVVPSAHAEQVDPSPKPILILDLIDDGYKCFPSGPNVATCGRDKYSPVYECRPSGCTPINSQHDPKYGTPKSQSGGTLSNPR